MTDTKINVDTKHAIGAAAAWKLGDTIRATGSLIFIVFGILTINGILQGVREAWIEGGERIEARKALFDEHEVYKVLQARCYAAIPLDVPEWRMYDKKRRCDYWAKNEMYNQKAQAIQRAKQRQPLSPAM